MKLRRGIPASRRCSTETAKPVGRWLAQNFENLKPEKAIWEKHAHLFTNIDSEQERFLEFERWWSGFYFLGREEILAITQNLFIGNQIEQGLFRICAGCNADLRRIRNPLVVFDPLAQDNPLIEREREAIGQVTQALEKIREARDAVYEQAFGLLFRQPETFDPK